MPVKELIKPIKDKIWGFNPFLFIFYKSSLLGCSLSIFIRVFSSILELFCFGICIKVKMQIHRPGSGGLSRKGPDQLYPLSGSHAPLRRMLPP
jgi:hypothetical protein